MSAMSSSYDPQLDIYFAAYNQYIGTAGARHLCLSLGDALAAAGDKKAQGFFEQHAIPADSEIRIAYQNAAALLQQKQMRIHAIEALKDPGEKAQAFYTLLMDKTFAYDPKVASLIIKNAVSDARAHPGEARMADQIKASHDPRLNSVKQRVKEHLDPPPEKVRHAVDAGTATIQGAVVPVTVGLEGQPGRPGFY